jgi:hypothetical protein
MNWMDILKNLDINFVEDCCADLRSSVIANFSNTGTTEWNKWLMFVTNSTLNGECEEVEQVLSRTENEGIDYFKEKFLNVELTSGEEGDLYLKLREIYREYESCLEDTTMLDHRFR